MTTRGRWENKSRKKILTGKFQRNRNSTFTIFLDPKDKTKKTQRVLIVSGEVPEWDGWKLMKKNKKGVQT